MFRTMEEGGFGGASEAEESDNKFVKLVRSKCSTPLNLGRLGCGCSLAREAVFAGAAFTAASSLTSVLMLLFIGGV